MQPTYCGVAMLSTAGAAGEYEPATTITAKAMPIITKKPKKK